MDCTQVLDTSELEDSISYDQKTEVAKLKINHEEFPVYSGNNRIGRDPEFCSVVVNNMTLSKEHAVIEVLDCYSHVIYDLGSKNKTKLGKMRLTPHVRYHLSHKTCVQFGDVKAEYCILSEEANDCGVVEESDDEIIPETPVQCSKFVPEPKSNSVSPTIFEMSSCDCGDAGTCGKLLGKPCGNSFINKQASIAGKKLLQENQSSSVNKEAIFVKSNEKSSSGDETDPEDYFQRVSHVEKNCKKTLMKGSVSPNRKDNDSSETDMSNQEEDEICNVSTQIAPIMKISDLAEGKEDKPETAESALKVSVGKDCSCIGRGNCNCAKIVSIYACDTAQKREKGDLNNIPSNIDLLGKAEVQVTNCILNALNQASTNIGDSYFGPTTENKPIGEPNLPKKSVSDHFTEVLQPEDKILKQYLTGKNVVSLSDKEEKVSNNCKNVSSNPEKCPLIEEFSGRNSLKENQNDFIFPESPHKNNLQQSLNMNATEAEMLGDASDDIYCAATQIIPSEIHKPSCDVHIDESVPKNEKNADKSMSSSKEPLGNQSLKKFDDIYCAATQVLPSENLKLTTDEHIDENVPKIDMDDDISMSPKKLLENLSSLPKPEGESISSDVEDESFHCLPTQVISPARQNLGVKDKVVDNSISETPLTKNIPLFVEGEDISEVILVPKEATKNLHCHDKETLCSFVCPTTQSLVKTVQEPVNIGKKFLSNSSGLGETHKETRNNTSAQVETNKNNLNLDNKEESDIDAICDVETQILRTSQDAKSFVSEGPRCSTDSENDEFFNAATQLLISPQSNSNISTSKCETEEKKKNVSSHAINTADGVDAVTQHLPNSSSVKDASAEAENDDLIFIAPTQLVPSDIESRIDKFSHPQSLSNAPSSVMSTNNTQVLENEDKASEEANKSMSESFFVAPTQLISGEGGVDYEDEVKSPLSTSSTYSSIHEAPTQSMDEIDGLYPILGSETPKSVEIVGACSSTKVEIDVSPKEKIAVAKTIKPIEQSAPKQLGESSFCDDNETVDLILPSSQELKETGHAIYGESNSEPEEISSPVLKTKRACRAKVQSKECINKNNNKLKLNVKLFQNDSNSDSDSSCEIIPIEETIPLPKRNVKKLTTKSFVKQGKQRKDRDYKNTNEDGTNSNATSNSETPDKVTQLKTSVVNSSKSENESTSCNNDTERPSRLRKMTWKARDSYDCRTLVNKESRTSNVKVENSNSKKKNDSLRKTDKNVQIKHKISRTTVESSVLNEDEKPISSKSVVSDHNVTSHSCKTSLQVNLCEKGVLFKDESINHKRKANLSFKEKDLIKPSSSNEINSNEYKNMTSRSTRKRTFENEVTNSDVSIESQKKGAPGDQFNNKPIKKVAKTSEAENNIKDEKNSKRSLKVCCLSLEKLPSNSITSNKTLEIDIKTGDKRVLRRIATRGSSSCVEEKHISTSTLKEIVEEKREITPEEKGKSEIVEEKVVIRNSKSMFVGNENSMKQRENVDIKKTRRKIQGFGSPCKGDSVKNLTLVPSKESDIGGNDRVVTKQKSVSRTLKDSPSVGKQLKILNFVSLNESAVLPKESNIIGQTETVGKSSERRRTRHTRGSERKEVKNTNSKTNEESHAVCEKTNKSTANAKSSFGKEELQISSKNKIMEPSILLKSPLLNIDEPNLATTGVTDSNNVRKSDTVLGSPVIKTRTRRLPKIISNNMKTKQKSSNISEIHSPESLSPVGESKGRFSCDPAPRKKAKHVPINTSSYDEMVKNTGSINRRGKRTNVKKKDEERNVVIGQKLKRTLQSNSSESLSSSGESTPKRSSRLSQRIQFKIMFTGVVASSTDEIAIKSLGGQFVEEVDECSVLVTDKVRRTYKFLCLLAQGKPIVTIEWLKQSQLIGHFVDPWNFVVEDKDAEKKFKFSLKKSLQQAASKKLLDGYVVFTTPSILPPPTEMKGIVECSGGKFLSREPSSTAWPEKSFVIASNEDKKLVSKFRKTSITLVSSELLLTGILQQKLNFSKHVLKC